MELLKEEAELIASTKELYYFCANQAEKYKQRDNAAALKIQSKFKMYMKRKEFLMMKAAAIKIETQFRASYARRQFRAKKAKDSNEKNLKYFEQQAIVIQKAFRGFFVRKYKHNFYLRQAQLRALVNKNEEFKKELQRFGEAQAQQAQQYQQQMAQAQFQMLAKNLHHLSSTKNIPGVYNSPFALNKPAVFDRTVEDHLKAAFKDTYKWKPPTKEQILKQSIAQNR